MNEISFTNTTENKKKIIHLIETINMNKKFSKLIIYSLNTLKSYLVVQNPLDGINNSISILQNHLIQVINSTFELHLENEEVMIKIGEICFYIISNLNSKSKDFEIFQNFKGIDLIKLIISKLPENQVESNKIFMKNLQIIIETIQNQNNLSIEEYFSIISSLINKFKDNNDLMIYLFETLKKISSIKKFKEIVTREFLQQIFSILSQTSSNKVATLGLQILDIIVKIVDIRDIIRSSHPISFVVQLLKKFKDDHLLSFHACGFLSKVLEKEDVFIFLRILKIKDLKHFESDIEHDNQYEGGLTEIKNMLANQDQDSYNSLKKNIARVLILMSKDKNFLQLLKDINSLDIFVGLLRSDLEFYFDKMSSQNDELLLIKNILPDLLHLILSLLKTYDLDYDLELNSYNFNSNKNLRSSITSQRISTRLSNNSITNNNPYVFKSYNSINSESNIFQIANNQYQLIKDIYFCLIKSLFIFSDNSQIVHDILEYISSKDKKLMEDILKEFDWKEILLIMTNLLKKYYDKKWIYFFFHKFFLYPMKDNMTISENSETDHVFINVKALQSFLESTRVHDFSNYEDLLNLIFETALHLNFSIGSNYNFNDNSFHEFYKFFYQLIDFFRELKSTKGEDSQHRNSELINSVVTLIFTAAENKNFGMMNHEEKCKFIIVFLKEVIFCVNSINYNQTNENTNSYFSNIYKYFLLRLNRIVELKFDPFIKILFNDESTCDFILQILSLLKVQSSDKKLDEVLAKETLFTLACLLSNNSNSIQISRFLRENGLNLLIQICFNGVYDFDISKLIIQIFQSFSNTHFKESALVFKNFFTFRNFIIQLKEIKFSKGINEKIYYEILVLFKNIIKSCEYCEAVEETNLVEHLVNEYSDIYCFYLDTRNRILEIISEIMAMFSRERALLKGLLNSKLPVVMENLLKYISENPEESGNDRIIEHIANTFISFFKTKEYSKLIYNNYKVSLEIIKTIIFNCKLSENCLAKLLTLCHLLVEYENSEIIKEKIITPAFLRELAMKIPSNQKFQKEMIEKCIMAIENPFIDKVRKSINESNSKLIKELSELVKVDRKMAFKRGAHTNSTEITSSSIEEAEDEKDSNSLNDPPKFTSRRSLLSIGENPTLKMHFENIVNNIGLITELILNPDHRGQINIEQESEQLSDLLKMLSILSKNEENVKRIYESNVIDKLIYIMEDDNDILTFAKDQGFNLIGKLIEDEEFVNKFFENGRACEFFLKELNKLCKFYSPESSEYIRNKVFIVTKIISKLSSDKSFVVNNSHYINIESIFYVLSTIQCDRDILLNLLVIFNNILLNNTTREFSNLKLSFVIHQLWTKYNEIRVIEKIMKIIENIYLEENIIRDLIDLNLVENINEVLKCSKTDSEGVLNLLELIDILMFYRYFAAKIIEQKTLNNLLTAITINMFNTKIIEKLCSIFIKGAKFDKNYIAILGVYHVNEFCLQILGKYMTTCHSNIIKQILELVFILISDENNLVFFSKEENMNIMLKCFKINLKNRDHVLLSLKLINVITTKDVEIKIEKSRGKKNTTKKRQNTTSTQDSKLTDQNSLVKISTSNENSSENSITYDFTILIEIINEILSSYADYIDIIMQLCDLINNIFNISSEIWLKKFMMDVIVNNADLYLKKQDYIQIFLNTMYLMIKSDQSILDIDCTSILYYISKILGVKLNYSIIITTLKMLKQIARCKNVNTSSNLTEIMKILKFLEENKSFHDDEIILLFSQILGYLCVNTSYYKEVSNEFIVFLLEYLLSKSVTSLVHSKLLEDLKNISVYFHIKNDIIADKVGDLIYKIFNLNQENKNKKNLMNIFQIISSLCIQSDFMKSALNENKFNSNLKESLSKDNFDDTLLDYQAKGCLLNLKLKKAPITNSRLTNSSTLRSMSIVYSQIEVKDEVKLYLTSERKIKLYTEKGEVKEKMISMTENLEKIMAYQKKNNKMEISEEMDVTEMDSCVRSCGTAAFSKSKGFFTKKPKPARCFSILGLKTLQGQKTFNIECEKEEECIKYVDYISILIQNYKTMKEDAISSNTDNNSLTNPFINLK